ncbi:ribonuclease H-like domain-containing protein [Tanacetum coccineum]
MSETEPIPPTSSVTALRIPIIKKGEYDLWSMKMRQYIAITDHILWDIITNGNQTTTDPASPSVSAPKTSLAANARRNNEKALNILLSAIPDRHLLSFHDAVDARSLWKAIKARFGGNEASKKMQKNLLKQQFETFTIGSREELDSAYERFQHILSMLELHDATVSIEDANLKFLRSLPSVWHVVATMIRGQPGLDELDFDDLYNNLKVYEHELKGVSNSSSPNIAFMSTEVKGSTLKQSTAEPTNIPKGYTQAASSKVPTAPNYASHSDEIISKYQENRANGRNEKRIVAIEDSNSKALVATENNEDIDWTKEFDAEPKGSTVGSQAVLPQTVKKSAMISPEQTWKPKGNYLDSVNRWAIQKKISKDYSIIDMDALEVKTGDKDKLSDFKEFKVVYVPLEDSKGGKNSQEKEPLRHPAIDFEERLLAEYVYSLDSKNIIPSGGITCLVAKSTRGMKLSSGFTFQDIPRLITLCVQCRKGKHTGILLRRLRNDTESEHLLKCSTTRTLFGTLFSVGKEYKTIKVLLLRHKVKTIRCDHGTEFKNQLMNEFCAKKGIKREYSIARTPQQNGVAERKNRTLIEAARTMLADSLLPIQFWAEAVNTACYVLNRVLVTKPQLKTPYEILMGRSPNISFMRPFGCSLTILNTLDHLGKFDGKSEEGYLLGYSTNSKGFRVYNRITRKVQDCLHVNFLENQENQKGKGPDWMFDLDLLTPSMNYIPVRKENYAKGIQDDQDKYVKDILNKFDFRTIKPASTPIEAHKSLGKDEEGEDVDVHLYRSMIGCLMYLTASRPDIMFAVCLCARFQVTPKVFSLSCWSKGS